MDVETHNQTQSKAKSWIQAMRLRTLPLALACTTTGGFLAFNDGGFSVLIFALTGLTTVLLQINSNLANDYGDFEKGTDNDSRVGPQRALQSGAIQPVDMKVGIATFSALSFFCGAILLWLAPIDLLSKATLLLAGVAAIYASVRYTTGHKPYGYRGLGDVSVMLFFGLLGVIGSYFVQTSAMNFWVLLPAIALGCLSAGVLNVNNTRDLESDKASGKITLAVRLGAENARKYHVILIAVAIDCMLIFGWYNFSRWTQWLFVLAFPLLLLNATKVYRTNEAAKLDPFLKQLAISTFLMALLLAIGMVV
jgi:1,4-dihydroxy-2-naphthoate polyprenyltransferase